MIAYLDTQVVIRLVQGRHDLITANALAAIESSGLLISPMVAIELEYLYEIGRLRVRAADIIRKLEVDIDLMVCAKSFIEIANTVVGEKWTRDPFDRIIVAHARANGLAPLITSDETIRANYINAVW